MQIDKKSKNIRKTGIISSEGKRWHCVSEYAGSHRENHLHKTVNFHKDIRNISDHVSSATSITEGTGYGVVTDNR
jgi:hypothetical protein